MAPEYWAIKQQERRRARIVVESPPVSSPLLTSLIAYWKLDETSGTRADAHSTNHLTARNGTGSTASGKINQAADFVAASSQDLFIADNAALSVADESFTCSAWVYRRNTPEQFILCKRSGFTGWYLRSKPAASANIEMGYTDGSVVKVSKYSGTFTINTWYFAIGWYDASADTLNLQVNDGTVITTTGVTGTSDNAEAFCIGSEGGGGNFWNGYIDEVGFWKRLLTPAERTSLYNSGNGLAYPFA